MEECKYMHLCNHYNQTTHTCRFKSNIEGCPIPIRFSYALDKSLLEPNQQKIVKLYKEAPDKNGVIVDDEAFDTLKQIRQDINNFVLEGKNLCLFSANCGNGKTSWAKNLLLGYMIDNWEVLSMSKCNIIFVEVIKLFEHLKNSFNDDSEREKAKIIKAWIKEARLVVWDDIGIQAVTPFENQELLSLINERLDNNKANIFTANLDTVFENGRWVTQTLESKLGPRLYSRIVNNADYKIELFGQDKRGMIK